MESSLHRCVSGYESSVRRSIINAKRFLIFQHLAIEHPGIFLDFFNQDKIEIEVVDFSVSDNIPDIGQFDALWVMGGPMDVWQESSFPWLIKEKAAIKQCVNVLGLPFMGICLGHQLLADALGGDVGEGQLEVGISQVQKTPAGRNSPFMEGFDDESNCLQWHGAEVKAVPEGFEVLMASDKCHVQAMARGCKVFSMQFHQEITHTTVTDWSKIPEYNQALELVLGDNAVASLSRDAAALMSEFNASARQLYNNWKKSAFSE